MFLRSLEIQHFRVLREVHLKFGRGLNVLFGPNDLGKSCLAEALRAAFLLPVTSKASEEFIPWGTDLVPQIVVEFDVGSAVWRITKTFGSGPKGTAFVERLGVDGSWHKEAGGKAVDARVREILAWGIPAPGEKGAPKGLPTSYLTTALLGRQDEVKAILEASLEGDKVDSGRDLITKALGALGQVPLVSRLLQRLDERVQEAFTPKTVQPKKGGPIDKLTQKVVQREKLLRELEEKERHSKEIEQKVQSLTEQRSLTAAKCSHLQRRLERLRAVKKAEEELECVQANEWAREEARRALAESEGAVKVKESVLQDLTQVSLSLEEDLRMAQDLRTQASSARDMAQHADVPRRVELERKCDAATRRVQSAQEVIEAERELAQVKSKYQRAKQAADRAQTEQTELEAEERNIEATLAENTAKRKACKDKVRAAKPLAIRAALLAGLLGVAAGAVIGIGLALHPLALVGVIVGTGILIGGLAAAVWMRQAFHAFSQQLEAMSQEREELEERRKEAYQQRGAAQTRVALAQQTVADSEQSLRMARGRLSGARSRFEALPGTCGIAAEQVMAEAERERHDAHKALEVLDETLSAELAKTERELQEAVAEVTRLEAEQKTARDRVAAATQAFGEARTKRGEAWGKFEALPSSAPTAGVAAEAALVQARKDLESCPGSEDLSAAQVSLEEWERSLRAIEIDLHQAQGKLQDVGGIVARERHDQEFEALEVLKKSAEELELECRATKHLFDVLKDAEERHSAHLGRSLAKLVTGRFQELTAGRYAEVVLAPDLRVLSIGAKGAGRELESFSVGTRDQLAALVRLALAAYLKTVIVLDDQLTQSDTCRLDWFREMLRASVRDHEYQIVVITCRPSDYLRPEEMPDPTRGRFETEDGKMTVVRLEQVISCG